MIAIVGPSGSGKSTSLRNLPPESTRIIDIEKKGFPFPGANKFKILAVDNINEYVEARNAAYADPEVKYVVHESFTKYVEKLLAQSRRNNKGYEIYSWYNRNITEFLDTCKNPRVINIFTAIDEIVRIPLPEGGEQAVRRVAVSGKEHEGKIEKEFLMVLFTDPRRNKPGEPMEYRFITNSDGIVSAKTPMGMFKSLYVPNDIMAVINEAKAYYGTDTSSID